MSDSQQDTHIQIFIETNLPTKKRTERGKGKVKFTIITDQSSKKHQTDVFESFSDFLILFFSKKYSCRVKFGRFVYLKDVRKSETEKRERFENY